MGGGSTVAGVGSPTGWARRRVGRPAVRAAALILVLAAIWPGSLQAEQAASQLRTLQHGFLAAGEGHTCAILDTGAVRCWGSDWLGYPGNYRVGDDEAPGSVGPVDLGPGRTARAVAAGDDHTCAILDTGAVRCWGYGGSGQLGYGNMEKVGDDETPGSVGPVDLGPGRTARAITAGGSHTCAILDTGAVRCWGYGHGGALGYGNNNNVGDNETPGSVGPVDLGPGRTARAIAAGRSHTCATLDTGAVLCWGSAHMGKLGYGNGNTNNVGDDETPGSVGPVKLGEGRTARGITGGPDHTCATLDDGALRCWGWNLYGETGVPPSQSVVGDNETPDAVSPVDLGEGRTAVAVSASPAGYGGWPPWASGRRTCALLDNGTVLCWGAGGSRTRKYSGDGPLGYLNREDVGDNETPGSVGPVDLGGMARAIVTGASHTCALLDDGLLRCWGSGVLGYPGNYHIGDDETPGSVGPLDLGGLLPAAVADVSLAMAADRTDARVGDELRLTVTATNAGPDPSGPVRIASSLPEQLELVGASASDGSYDPGTGIWSIAELAPGASATLELRVIARAPGRTTAAAELASAEHPDPDSVPANGADEDDRATATVTVTEPQQGVDTPPSFSASFPARVSRRTLVRRGVSGRVRSSEPARFRFQLRGRLRRTGRAPAGDVVLGKRALPLAGGSRRLRLMVSRRLARKLGRRLDLTVRITAIDAGGQRTTGRRRVRVRG